MTMPAHAPHPGNNSNLYGRSIRLVVYTMLVASAACTVFFGDHLWTAWRAGDLPVWAPLLPPVAFTAFVVVYTIDRWLLVRRRHYPLSRALFQVAFALVFLTLLLPPQAQEFRQLSKVHDLLGPRDAALYLLEHTDEAVRDAACNMLTGRFPKDVYEQVQSVATHDASARVRADCGHALLRLHNAAAN